MSVFTTVTNEQLRQWLQAYSLGDLLDFQGIAAGITNTNYFVTTTSGRYVLTLFEKHTQDELPYFLDLMTHLAERDILCPHPIRKQDGSGLCMLNAKPAALVSCLRGKDVEMPSSTQCASVGRLLAQMHIAGLSFPSYMKNPRGAEWRAAMAGKVVDYLDADDKAMLQQELEFQAKLLLTELPQGVIHADLFRDNVLFDGEQLGGVIDFYYACNDVLLYDLAIAANDWCIYDNGNFDDARLSALFTAYHAVRPINVAEQQAWPSLLRIAALRFWLSRLYDLHFPQVGELTHAKDPQHFQKILKIHIEQQQALALD